MPIQQSDMIEVKRVSGKGRGVFARVDIPEGTVIEKVPVLVMPDMDILDPDRDLFLYDYVFEWGKDTVALALGYGSLYNHSYQPNARYEDRGRQTKWYIAERDIAAGEEITINYNGDPDKTDPVGFDVVE